MPEEIIAGKGRQEILEAGKGADEWPILVPVSRAPVAELTDDPHLLRSDCGVSG